MNNTTNNEPRDYIFIFRYDYNVCIIKNADSLKDAVCKMYEKENVGNNTKVDLFRRALRGFDLDNDIDEIVSLYNLFNDCKKIDSIFLIDKKIYDCTARKDNSWKQT